MKLQPLWERARHALATPAAISFFTPSNDVVPKRFRVETLLTPRGGLFFETRRDAEHYAWLDGTRSVITQVEKTS